MFEMIAVAVIALLVLGPEEMVRQSQRLGRFLGKLRVQANNFKIMVESEVNQAELAPPPKVISPEVDPEAFKSDKIDD